mmetsp:Transcript_22229/g.48822  ORF Transcript_22229/g.48822 Transcript_22229/m.48822 type:complete len:242 (-) Transcript_22229:163-888(-)
MRHHGHGGGADAALDTAIGRHRLRPEEHLGHLRHDVRQHPDVHVRARQPARQQLLQQRPPLVLGAGVNHHDAEGDALLVRGDEGVLHHLAVRVRQHHVAVRDLRHRVRADHRVRKQDAVLHVALDGVDEARLGLRLRHLALPQRRHLHLQPPHRVAHGGGHGAAVLDEGDDGGDAAGEVAREGLLGGGLIVRDHLLEHLEHAQGAGGAAGDLPGGVLDAQLPHHGGDLRRAAHPQRHLAEQ